MDTRRRLSACAAIVCMSLLGGVVEAQNPVFRTKKSFDQIFVAKAAQGGMAEVEEGQVAVRRGATQSVKDFAQKMIDDHSKANDELKNVVRDKSVMLPSELSMMQKASLNKLDRLSGAAFDSTYIKGAKTDHLQAIKLFEAEVKKGTDPDLRAFASRTLPTIREHYKMLQDMKFGSKMSRM